MNTITRSMAAVSTCVPSEDRDEECWKETVTHSVCWDTGHRQGKTPNDTLQSSSGPFKLFTTIRLYRYKKHTQASPVETVKTIRIAVTTSVILMMFFYPQRLILNEQISSGKYS